MRVASVLFSSALVIAAAPSQAAGVRVVALGAPPLELRVPDDLPEVERSPNKIHFAGPAGSVIAGLGAAGELIDLRALRELAAKAASRPNTRVLEQALVEINGRPALKLVTSIDGNVRTLQYRCLVDSDHEAWITYVLPMARFDVLRGELEKIESATNRFANAEHARGITPEGRIGFPGVPVPAQWRVIGSDGKLIELPNKKGADPVYMTIAGALIVANPNPGGRGEGLEAYLLPEGRLDAAFVERQLASIRKTLGDIEILERRELRLSISDSAAQKVVVAARAVQDGHPMLHLIYFATDELGRNWAVRYALRREHVAHWRPQLEKIESPAR